MFCVPGISELASNGSFRSVRYRGTSNSLSSRGKTLFISTGLERKESVKFGVAVIHMLVPGAREEAHRDLEHGQLCLVPLVGAGLSSS